MPALSRGARQKLEQPFAVLAGSLRAALKNRHMIFMQNDGNFGDSLIRYGTMKFFEDLGLQFVEFDMKSRTDKLVCLLTGLMDRFTDKYLFVYSSNGAWSVATNSGYRNIRRQRKATKNLFLLPTTFEKYRMDMDFLVYARDCFQSKDFIRDKPFCHDMAFYLALIAPERVLPQRTLPTKRTGVMLRTDNESHVHIAEELQRNYDISAFGGHRDNPQDFLRYIDQFEHIITDRLHVGIGGVLLGKKVTLLNGSYFKIKAIYDSSIAGIFDNVEFIENPSETFIRECIALSQSQASAEFARAPEPDIFVRSALG